NRFNLEDKRKRKLLAHKREIDRLGVKLRDNGLTLVPLRIYFNGNKVKLLIGVARGKKAYDKRQAIKERDAKRDIRSGE
ncbi:MAG TPA: SsrA-binding protein, partial [Candidatus Kapabacteria bacterium]|nr:SsrA-binding protein [Candidatus Kapabacteria bacterium]